MEHRVLGALQQTLLSRTDHQHRHCYRLSHRSGVGANSLADGMAVQTVHRPGSEFGPGDPDPGLSLAVAARVCADPTADCSYAYPSE